MESGKSTFKCSDCTRRSCRSPSNTSATSSETVLASGPLDKPASELDEDFVPSGLLRLIGSLSNKLDVLMAEVKCLRADNSSLRSQITQLRNNVMERTPLPSVPPTSYATVAAQSTVASILASTSASLPSSRNRPSNPAARLTPASVNPELRSGNAAHGSADVDGFTTVGPRRRTKPSLGTARPNKVTAVPRPERRLALFVSRLHPDTTVADVDALVKPFLNGKPVICSKMMTKFDTYSSFHLSGDESVFNVINNSEVWPEGSIFHQFFGRLDSSRVQCVSPEDNVDGEQG